MGRIKISKRSLCSLIVSFLLIFNIIVLGQAKEKKVELEVVWEKQFDEPVVDVIFDEVEMTVKEAKLKGWRNIEGKKDNEKVKVPFPKVKFTPVSDKDISFRKEEQRIEKIKFYNKEGNIIKKVKIDKQKREFVRVSKNRKYVVVSMAPGVYDPDTGGGTLYNSDGTTLWTMKKGYSPVEVSDEGYVIALPLDAEGTAVGYTVFYDINGQKINKIENPYVGGMGGCSGEFIDDEYVLLAFRNWNKTTVILTTKFGSVLWNKEFGYSMLKFKEFYGKRNLGIAGIGTTEIVQEDTMSPGGLKYSYKNYVCFIDWYGNLIWTVPLEIKGDMKVKFSNDNKKCYVTSTEGYLWCIELSTGNLLWKHREEWSPDSNSKSWPDNVPNFYEMEVIGNYVYVIGKYIKWNERNWHNSVLLIFDSENGNLIKKIEYPNKRISLISQNNRIFILDIDARKVSLIKTKEISK